MRFTVLGPIAATVNGTPVPISRPRQQAILGYILLNRNALVSTDRLVTALWDHDIPATARNQIQTDLSILRRLIRSAGAPDPIETRPTGYMIRVGVGQLDLDEFAARVRDAHAATDPATSATILRSALDLWTGNSLAGVTAAYATSHRVHLEERRLQSYEQLFDLELCRGRHTDVVAELVGLVEQHPLRERLVGQLMLALYRTGRHADALGVARSMRATLAEQHGLDPGRALTELEQAILRGDPALDIAALDVAALNGKTAPVEPRSHAAVPMQLPRDLYGITARAEQIGRLDGILAGSRQHGLAVAVLTGTAGVGKTTLAVHWAHRVSDQFPDGQLYVNLRGFDANPIVLTPTEVLSRFLTALGEQPERLPEEPDVLASLYRTRMATRRMLVVLDNARDAAQVRPMLPGNPDCAVLVTSRNQLSGLVASDAVQIIVVDVLTDGEAMDLMVRRWGPERVSCEPEAAVEIATRCARLPLALSIVAANAVTKPTMSLTALAAELGRVHVGLDAFQIGGESVDIAAVFSWSYDTLSPPAAELFRVLGNHPVPEVSFDAAASLIGAPRGLTRTLFAELTRASLVNETSPDRFTVHDLLRAYAQEKAGAADTDASSGIDGRRAAHRLLDHYLHSALRASILFQPKRKPLVIAVAVPGVTVASMQDRGDALAWLQSEHAALVAVATQAGSWGFDTHVWQLAWCLIGYPHGLGRWSDSVRVQSAAVESAQRIGDRTAMATSHRGLANAMANLGRFDEAEAHSHTARRLWSELGNQRAEALSLQTLGDILQRQHRYADAHVAFAQALAIYQEAGDVLGRAATVNNIGLVYVEQGRYAEALPLAEEALTILSNAGEVNGAGAALDTLARAYQGQGNYESAIDYFERAINRIRKNGERLLEARTLTFLGDTHMAIDDPPAAALAWTRALDILRQLDDPFAAKVQTKLDALNPPP